MVYLLVIAIVVLIFYLESNRRILNGIQMYMEFTSSALEKIAGDEHDCFDGEVIDDAYEEQSKNIIKERSKKKK